jgi:hypothetical protein
MHLPRCDVPSPDCLGVNEGFVWLHMDDFVGLFDIIYECRLVNSDLGPPEMTGIPFSPGWVPGMAWFEELWAFQGDVSTESAPCFLIDVPQGGTEIVMEVSQTDVRYEDRDEAGVFIRGVQAPLLLRFYECSREVSEFHGGEVYLVHLSAWGHTRDACTAVKVKAPGRYMAMVSVPAMYTCRRMIFRTYSTLPIQICPVVSHRSFTAVMASRPLGAIPYHLAGFQRIDSPAERMPQMFNETEGRGMSMANPMHLGAAAGFGTRWGRVGPNQWGMVGPRQRWPFPWPCALLERGQQALGDSGAGYYGNAGHYNGMQVVGKFGGQGSVSSVDANEKACTVM